MGHSLDYYVILAKNYMQHVRPKLFKYYGPLSQSKMIRQQKLKRYDKAIEYQVYHKLGYAKYVGSIDYSTKSHFEKYIYQTQQGKKYKGSFDSELDEEIKKEIEKDALYKHNDANHFLRKDHFMGIIDQFSRTDYGRFRNFIKYTQFINQSIVTANPWISRQYQGSQQANQIFNEVYKVMKQTKQETYFILELS